MLRVPAWKSALWPHEYDLMSSSVGSWRSWRQRGEALGVGMATGYGRKRQWLLLLVDGFVGGGVGLSSESVGGDGDCTGGLWRPRWLLPCWIGGHPERLGVGWGAEGELGGPGGLGEID